MPKIPPDELLPYHLYTRVLPRTLGKVTQRFLGLGPNGRIYFWSKHNTFVDLPDRNRFDYYLPGDPDIPDWHNFPQLPLAAHQVVPLTLINGLVPLLAQIPHIGNTTVPSGLENSISYEEFNNGDEIVIITEGGHDFYYHIDALNNYYINLPSTVQQVVNPLTNRLVGNRYTGVLQPGVIIQRATVTRQPDVAEGGSKRRKNKIRTLKRSTKKLKKTRRNYRR